MKRRLFSLLLTGAMLLSMCPPGLALEADTGGLCPHHQEHNYEDCGFIEAVEGQPCGYVCRICPVQAMLDALPNTQSVTPENRADVEAQLTAIDGARAGLTDEETEQLDISRYQAVVSALSALDGQAGADIPMPAVKVVEYLFYDTDGQRWETKTVGAYNVTAGSDWNTSNGGWYVVDGNSPATIDRRITVTGDVNLILADGYSLTVTGGINVCEGNSLTIYGQSDGTGALISASVDGNAGIGGNVGSNGGIITINGGIVTATGGGGGTGIGGGKGGDGGRITINGGNVTAKAPQFAAGIGGGENGGNAGTITINGGTVTACNTYYGTAFGSAGIGGNGEGGTIVITGGTVNADGGKGPGIGGSENSSVIISGGTVTASSMVSAGIGNSYRDINSVTFATGQDGSAFITASSIADLSGKEDWHGVIFEGDSGQVYGSPTLKTDAEIPSGNTLTIENGQTLTISAGITLTNNYRIINNGTLKIDGTLINNDTITGDGTIIGTISGNKITPIVTAPSNLTATYGQTLADVSLPTGWEWDDSATAVGNVGNNSFPATYTHDNSGNYNEVRQSLAVTVGKATPTPTAPDNLTATYGQTLADVSLPAGWAWDNASTTSVGNVGSNTFSATFTPVDTVNYITVTQSLTVTVGRATPTVSVAVSLSGSAGAREAALTVTVTGVTNGAVPTETVTLTGSNSLNQSLTLTNGTASYIWTGLTDGNYTVTAEYGGDGNYNTASAEKAFNTSKQGQAALTISDVGSKTYGDPEFTLSASGGSGTGAVTYESSAPSVISISGTTATIHKAGGPVTITATKAEDENYNATSDTLNVTVGKKAVVFKANDKTVQQGGTMPTFDYAPVTLAYSDSITAEPTPACTATDTSTVGTFTITLSGAALTNGDSYEISYQPGTLTVTAQSTYIVTVNGGTGGGSYTAGDTVTITATVPSGQRFTGWTVNEGGVTLANASSATTTFTMPARAVIVTANFQSNSGGGGGGSYTPPTYKPDVSKPSGGGGEAPAVSPSNPKQGDTVTVTPKPDDGYEVDKITVTDKSGNDVPVTKKPDGTYTFTQPSGRVTIEIEYAPVPLTDLPWNNPFSDVSEGDWYYEAVRFVYERGLMSGYSDGRFGPNDTLSRAQLAQILFNKEGRPGVNYLLTFSDVAGEAWYTEAIRWATSQGIVGGYGDGRFGPNDPITREQLAVMLWRYSGSPAATDKELHFNDTDEISPFALEAMRWAVENGILNGYGDGRLGPQGQATRAQVAQILKNFIENQESK